MGLIGQRNLSVRIFLSRPTVLKMEAVSPMPRLLNMTARTLARHFLAVFMLVAMGAPYVHAAAEFGEHEQCSMEMCKRTGKCCCRRANAGKPHFSPQDVCHSSGAQLPLASSGAAAILSETCALVGLAPVAELTAIPEVTAPGVSFSILRFQRPPPQLL
jgi:hypothetical protein